jgi:ferredoxin
VDVYLKTHKPKKIRTEFRSSITHISLPELDEYMKESVRYPGTEPEGGFIIGFTEEEAIREAKRCMHCDCRKPVSCKLRIYSDEYHANRKRYAGPTRKSLTRVVQHEKVVYEPEKCIKCGLCVEITRKENESIGLTFIGRGFDVRIDVPFNKTTREALTHAAELCVQACPTGALSDKTNSE